MLIGAGLVTGIRLRAVLLAFFVHMAGVVSTLALLPREVWVHPLVPSFDGQYILKNVVPVACWLHLAALELGAPQAKSEPVGERQ
ncbi:hypothetical protein KIH74_21200 [Kineosporia sp. J2-2]|uniref:DUF417 family protein n=1 Tax=Kineosporia corallincola TaxID=2835133 RepID=A0ABS5TK36_9ACTN|nr:hypothetical protein [Kineosporia corallincola]MBT0771468.1 hypothetical protein [Kineosporia corallincola]